MLTHRLLALGFDVCHDPRDKKKSYGALVATMDIKMSSDFFSAVQPHCSGEELSNQLSLDIVKAIKQYRDENNALPERICMFRDGVGEGQIEYLIEHELNAINEQLKEVYANAGVVGGPRFLFVIVSKRINTRFFANRANPPAGTVVDDVITLPERWDMLSILPNNYENTMNRYFCSFQLRLFPCIAIGSRRHCGAHKLQRHSWHVWYDSWSCANAHIQIYVSLRKFANPSTPSGWDRFQPFFSFCFQFNWSGTVRVPALCQYAHKLAFLVSQSLHQRPASDLERKLYFL